MADRKDYYFLQVVEQNELDEAFDGLEQADWDIASDLGLAALSVDADNGGIMKGLVASGTGGLNVQVTPGAAYDDQGRRVAIDATKTVVVSATGDTEPGAGGTPTGGSSAIPSAGNKRWVSLFVVFDRKLSDPRTDGAGWQVYFDRGESFRFYVSMGSEAVNPTNLPPLESGKVLLADFRITSASVIDATSVDRRQVWLRARDSGSVPVQRADTVVGGTPNSDFPVRGFEEDDGVREALKKLLGYYNDHVRTDGKAADNHLASNFEIAPYGWIQSTDAQSAFEEIVDDLGSTTPSGDGSGASLIGFDNSVTAWLTSTDVQDVIDEIAQDVLRLTGGTQVVHHDVEIEGSGVGSYALEVEGADATSPQSGGVFYGGSATGVTTNFGAIGVGGKGGDGSSGNDSGGGPGVAGEGGIGYGTQYGGVGVAGQGGTCDSTGVGGWGGGFVGGNNPGSGAGGAGAIGFGGQSSSGTYGVGFIGLGYGVTTTSYPDGAGVYGEGAPSQASASTPAGAGMYGLGGVNSSACGTGVWGEGGTAPATTDIPGGTGLWGQGGNTTGTSAVFAIGGVGVYGIGGTCGPNATVNGIGVYGAGASGASAINGGHGVFGQGGINGSSGNGGDGINGIGGICNGGGNPGNGVYGQGGNQTTVSGSGGSGLNGHGGLGYSNSSGGRGVEGHGGIGGATGDGGAGVAGYGGAAGASGSMGGMGVYGKGDNSTGSITGGYGAWFDGGLSVTGQAGHGVYAKGGNSTSGSDGHGVYGEAGGTNSYGVYGTGPWIGVYGLGAATSTGAFNAGVFGFGNDKSYGIIAQSNNAGERSAFRLSPQGTDPSIRQNGDMWTDGTNLYVQLGGSKRTVTVT